MVIKGETRKEDQRRTKYNKRSNPEERKKSKMKERKRRGTKKRGKGNNKRVKNEGGRNRAERKKRRKNACSPMAFSFKLQTVRPLNHRD